ncbi:MAG: NUDIX domain-containing protein [Clostridia bacterium]|nr:NUDIX domain-containing protein [Clostridia bacterium]
MPDICVPCGGGLVNLRVGAVIVKNGKILMVGNPRADYCYSVGGRIKFGETAQEAVVREVFEETGVKMTVDRLVFVHENCFYGDAPTNLGKLIYEISFFFRMNVPDDFEPVSRSFTEDDSPEFLCWVAPDTPKKIYPEFFRTKALCPEAGVSYYLTDERKPEE